jgi:hypothetical protein
MTARLSVCSIPIAISDRRMRMLLLDELRRARRALVFLTTPASSPRFRFLDILNRDAVTAYLVNWGLLHGRAKRANMQPNGCI